MENVFFFFFGKPRFYISSTRAAATHISNSSMEVDARRIVVWYLHRMQNGLLMNPQNPLLGQNLTVH